MGACVREEGGGIITCACASAPAARLPMVLSAGTRALSVPSSCTSEGGGGISTYMEG